MSPLQKGSPLITLLKTVPLSFTSISLPWFNMSYNLSPYEVMYQFSSAAEPCPTLCDPMDCSTQASLSITNFRSLLRLMSIESVMPSNHLILCRPLLLLPPVFSSFRVFSNESVLCIRQPKYWSFSFSISPSNEYSGLISFKIGWISLQSKGLSRVLSNTSVQKHRFFGAQLFSMALTRWAFVGKVMSLLFNTLSGLVIGFLSKSKHLLISWLPKSL